MHFDSEWSSGLMFRFLEELTFMRLYIWPIWHKISTNNQNTVVIVLWRVLGTLWLWDFSSQGRSQDLEYRLLETLRWTGIVQKHFSVLRYCGGLYMHARWWLHIKPQLTVVNFLQSCKIPFNLLYSNLIKQNHKHS